MPGWLDGGMIIVGKCRLRTCGELPRHQDGGGACAVGAKLWTAAAPAIGIASMWPAQLDGTRPHERHEAARADLSSCAHTAHQRSSS